MVRYSPPLPLFLSQRTRNKDLLMALALGEIPSFLHGESVKISHIVALKATNGSLNLSSLYPTHKSPRP